MEKYFSEKSKKIFLEKSKKIPGKSEKNSLKIRKKIL